MNNEELIYPVGEQDFENIILKGKVYVDKTHHVYRLTHTNDFYFLSRPRRFGKSLLVSTLKAFFEGKRHLFKGLFLENAEVNWEKHAVINLDLSIDVSEKADVLEANLRRTLMRYADSWNTKLDPRTSVGKMLEDIVLSAYRITRKGVVILIDEYDAPILNVIDRQPEEIQAFRAVLNDLFAPLKGLAPCLRFVFVTGITKFSQMSIFSKLNNLCDISMMREYDSICGISKEELRTTLRPGVLRLAEELDIAADKAFDLLGKKYDGYHFGNGKTDIFNPFSLISALSAKDIKDFWFSSGTPSFLVKLLKERKQPLDISELENASLPESAFNQPVENIADFMPMLYQSGYMTIKVYDSLLQSYTLGFPNEEVRVGMSNVILEVAAPGSPRAAGLIYTPFLKALFADDIDSCLEILKTFLCGIPYDLPQGREDYFQTILYTLFKILGAPVYNEVKTARGRLDIMVETPTTVYVMELKYDQSPDVALRQIAEKGYAEPYKALGKKIRRVGINFSLDLKTIAEWKVE